MPRFVLLTHDHPTWHWDFMLEHEGHLRTWRLDSDPQSPGLIRITQLPDHRLIYLDYEGPVSQQRGTVQRWDRGEYQVIQPTNSLPAGESVNDVQAADEVLIVRLKGAVLRGRATLRTTATGTGTFQFEPDTETPTVGSTR